MSQPPGFENELKRIGHTLHRRIAWSYHAGVKYARKITLVRLRRAMGDQYLLEAACG